MNGGAATYPDANSVKPGIIGNSLVISGCGGSASGSDSKSYEMEKELREHLERLRREIIAGENVGLWPVGEPEQSELANVLNNGKLRGLKNVSQSRWKYTERSMCLSVDKIVPVIR